MDIEPIPEIKDAFINKADVYADHRGHFEELFNFDSVKKHVNVDIQCVPLIREWNQISYSSSHKHVVRGIHCTPYPKFVTCLSGLIYDVIVDLREESPTYLNWFGLWLDSPKKQIYIPSNCGHGFYSAENNSRLLYLQTEAYSPDKNKNYNWKDPAFGIEWPFADYVCILSEADKNAPLLDFPLGHI